MENEVLSMGKMPEFNLSIARASRYWQGKKLSEEEQQGYVQELSDMVLEVFVAGRNVVSSYLRIGYILKDIDKRQLYRYWN